MTSENLPGERLLEEWKKLLTKGVEISRGLSFLRDTGWVRYYPELAKLIDCPQDPAWHPEGDVWNHTSLALDGFAKHRIGDEYEDFVVGLAVLCHDFGKPATTLTDPRTKHIRSLGHDEAGVEPTLSFLRRLTNEERILRDVPPLVKCHMQPFAMWKAKVGDAAIRRLAMRVVRIDRLLRVARADDLGRPPELSGGSSSGEDLRWLAAEAERLRIADAAPKPILQGRDLIALGLTPGPQFGELLSQCFDAQLDGKFTTREDAVSFLKSILKNHDEEKKSFLKTMKRHAVLLMTAATFSLFCNVAHADKVSPDTALSVARVWMESNPHALSMNLSGECTLKETCTNAFGEALFYVIQFSRGGYVWLSADTAAGPVIAVGQERSPLLTGIEGEAIRSLAEETVTLGMATDSAAMAGIESEVSVKRAKAASPGRNPRERWAELISNSSGLRLMAAKMYDEIEDVRCAPFLKTRWGQSHIGLPFFNKYTPNECVAGCVSIAGAQVMRYFKHPESISSFTRLCAYNGKSTNIFVRAHTFNWDLMPYEPQSYFYEEQAEETGFLAFALGVECESEYGLKATTATLQNLANAFTRWGYSVASKDLAVSSATTMKRDVTSLLLPALDAKTPVIFGIKSSTGAGHAAVADGYGYVDGVLFVHMNLGWNGSENIWYALPEINSSIKFTSLSGMIYNIVPGTNKVCFVSGRIFGEDGKPLANAEVRATKNGNAYVARTDEKGFYGVHIPMALSGGTLTLTPYYDSAKGIETSFRFTKGVNTGEHDMTFSYGHGVDVSKELKIERFTNEENRFSLAFQAINGRTYHGESSSDLITWQKDESKTVTASGEETFNFSSNEISPRRFFRVTRTTEFPKREIVVNPTHEDFSWEQSSNANNNFPSKWERVYGEEYEGASAMKLVIPEKRSESVSMSATITGPVKVSFDYKYCLSHAEFAVLLDDEKCYSQTAENHDSPWIRAFLEIPEGEHSLTFLCDRKEAYFWPGLEHGVTIDNLKFDRKFVNAPQFHPSSTAEESTATTFENEMTISINAPEGVKVYYSIDSSVPTPETALLYKEPFTIKKSSLVRAVAIKDGYGESGITSALYRRSPPVSPGVWSQDAEKTFRECASSSSGMIILVCNNVASNEASRAFYKVSRNPAFLSWAQTNDVCLIDYDESLYPDAKNGRDLFWNRYIELTQQNTVQWPQMIFCKNDGTPVAAFGAISGQTFRAPGSTTVRTYDGSVQSLLLISKSVLDSLAN